MWILLVAIVLLGLKLGAVGPFATLSWWWIAIPLGLAFLWWEIIDPKFGVSQRRAMAKVEERKAERNARARRNLGLHAPRGDKNGKGR
jgi:small Trp-rich protein